MIIFVTDPSKKYSVKILKYLLFIILLIGIGGAVYFGVKDGVFDISSTKEMDVPLEMLYTTVNEYKTWKEWGPWMEYDQNIKFKYPENTIGKGASYSWASEHRKVGDGSMLTIDVEPNKTINQVITFNTPIGDSKSDMHWIFDPVEGSTKTNVTWGMKGESSLMEKVLISLSGEPFEENMKSMFENGLENLEKNVQAEMKKYTITVNGIKQHGGGYYLYTTTVSKISEISEKMAPMMGQVAGYLQENNITMTGMPFTIYNQIDEANGTVIFSACISVNERIITPKGSLVYCGYMEPSRSLKTTLSGNYINLPEAYNKAMEYMTDNNMKTHPAIKMFEVYSTDPGEVPNPANWITEIYIPLDTSSINED